MAIETCYNPISKPFVSAIISGKSEELRCARVEDHLRRQSGKYKCMAL